MMRWSVGARTIWRGTPCTLEYVADDAALVSYRRPGEALRFAIVSLSELAEPPKNGARRGD